MVKRVNHIFLLFHGVMMIFFTTLIIFGHRYTKIESILTSLMENNGWLELALFFILLMISSYATITLFSNVTEKVYTRPRRNFVASIALLVYLIAMQEVRWGQFLGGPDEGGSSENLKGFVGNGYLSNLDLIYQVIYFLVFLLFILIPIILYFRPSMVGEKPSNKGKLIIYLPSIHNILMFLFATWVYAFVNPITSFDTVVLSAATLGMIAIHIKCKQLQRPPHYVHMLLLIIVIVGLWMNQSQYPLADNISRIWKFVLAYSFFHWLLGWTINLRQRTSDIKSSPIGQNTRY